jgi:hypothetical protein
MAALKHIGKMKNTGSKVVVVFRTLPGESNTALVLPAATLPDSYHNSLMALIETDQAQQSFELGELMFVRLFPDGRQMLQAMQQDGRLQKVPTDTVIMTPTNQTDIVLADLNVLIAEQKNCTIDDLCTFVKGYNASKDAASKAAEVKTVAEVKEVPAAPVRAQASQNEVLTDLDIAKSYRSQADAMYKEAARLRKQADDLDPPKKKATKVSETADA